MKTIICQGVNDAFAYGVLLLNAGGEVRPSRGGRVIEYPTPVTTEYHNSLQRVLFNPVRNANPFFHFFESLWMLRGRGDVHFVADMLPRMKEYSDDGVHMQGAYGLRWRSWFGYDQLMEVINQINADKETRRAVLTMWDPRDLVDRFKSKDIPCNTHVYFKQRKGRLDMTVCNRSNDIIWGAYGANAVHMGFLHEYVAARTELELGVYYQVSDSYHAYLEGPGGEVWERCRSQPQKDLLHNPYLMGVMSRRIDWNGQWDLDLEEFFDAFDVGRQPKLLHPWWKEVAYPMWLTFLSKRNGNAKHIQAPDWRLAVMQWIERRGVKHDDLEE